MENEEKQTPATARVGWIQTDRVPKPDYDSALVGKWQLFIPRSAVDKVWEEFERLTEEGELGISAKVSGLLSDPRAHDPNSHVVILYAADWRDVEDLRRMLRRIRKAGIEQAVYFKRDRETLASKYSGKDRPVVSVWGSPSGDMIRTKWVGGGKAWVEVTAENQEKLVSEIVEKDEAE